MLTEISADTQGFLTNPLQLHLCPFVQQHQKFLLKIFRLPVLVLLQAICMLVPCIYGLYGLGISQGLEGLRYHTTDSFPQLSAPLAYPNAKFFPKISTDHFFSFWGEVAGQGEGDKHSDHSKSTSFKKPKPMLVFQFELYFYWRLAMLSSPFLVYDVLCYISCNSTRTKIQIWPLNRVFISFVPLFGSWIISYKLVPKNGGADNPPMSSFVNLLPGNKTKA